MIFVACLILRILVTLRFPPESCSPFKRLCFNRRIAQITGGGVEKSEQKAEIYCYDLQNPAQSFINLQKQVHRSYHYERARKRRKVADHECLPKGGQSGVTRGTRSRFSAEKLRPCCFFFKKDGRVRDAALLLSDEKLLAKLSEGDLVAIEAKYHKSCLASLYNRVRNASEPLA